MNRKAKRAWTAALRRNLRRGRAYFVQIAHEDDCKMLAGACVCTCNADRILRDADGRELVRIGGAGRYDPTEVMFAGAAQ